MATQLQLRKGTKVQNDAFTGAEAELTYDSTSKGLRLHDGTQQGGYEVPVLVAVQRPTAENNYTWFRVWSDGWVEQGGYVARGTAGSITVTFPVELAEAPKIATQMMYNITETSNVTWLSNSFNSVTATSLSIYRHATIDKSWTVEGMRA